MKLLDYRTRIPELKKSRNPFAVVVLARLRIMEAGKDRAQLLNKYGRRKNLSLH